MSGAGLLDVSTVIGEIKTVKLTQGNELLFGTPVRGYKIHMGKTNSGGSSESFLESEGKSLGAISPNRKVFGTYLHGLFDSGAFRAAFLSAVADVAGISSDKKTTRHDIWTIKDESYNRLADHFIKYCDVDSVIAAMGL